MSSLKSRLQFPRMFHTTKRLFQRQVSNMATFNINIVSDPICPFVSASDHTVPWDLDGMLVRYCALGRSIPFEHMQRLRCRKTNFVFYSADR